MRERAKGQQAEQQIDLLELLMIYLRKWWLIVLCGILTAGITLLYTYFCITPLYRAGVSIYVNNVRSGEYIENVTSSDLSTSKMLVNTYVNIISSNTVLEKVISEAGLEYTPDQLRSMLSASQVNETEIFRVYITHPDPQEAARIANAVADAAPAEIEEFVVGSSCKIIDYAQVPQSRISPSYSRNTLLGGAVGVFAVVAVLTLFHFMDVRLKTEEDLEDLFELPVLGQVPVFTQSGQRQESYGYGSAPAGTAKKEGKA